MFAAHCSIDNYMEYITCHSWSGPVSEARMVRACSALNWIAKSRAPPYHFSRLQHSWPQGVFKSRASPSILDRSPKPRSRRKRQSWNTTKSENVRTCDNISSGTIISYPIMWAYNVGLTLCKNRKINVKNVYFVSVTYTSYSGLPNPYVIKIAICDFITAR